MNIWEYRYENDIRITTTDGKVYEGNVITIDDAEENEDMTEDEIVVETHEGSIVGLKQSEVAEIQKGERERGKRKAV